MQPDESTRAYTVPYVIDTAGASTQMLTAGIRIHWPTLQAGIKNIQVVNDFKNGIALGCYDSLGSAYHVNEDLPLSHLGVSLTWSNSTDKKKQQQQKQSMTTSIVRGMPYATMHYDGGVLPTLYSYNGLAPSDDDNTKSGGGIRKSSGKPSLPSISLDDGTQTLECTTRGGKDKVKTAVVERNIDLHFINSDFTWGMFVSRPVRIQCDMSEGDDKTRDFRLSVVEDDKLDSDEPLTVRVALLDECTTGKGNIKGHCALKKERDLKESYSDLLKKYAQTYPTSPQLQFTFPSTSSSEKNIKHNESTIMIDWGAQSASRDTDGGDDDLLMFALPHHQDTLDTKNVEVTDACVQTFHGNTCLVQGKTWTLKEDMGRPMSFTASRPPEVTSIPTLAEALADDIHYRLSDNMMRGAADTYFSGKILARVARVIAIADEMDQLASGKTDAVYNVSESTLSEAMSAASAASLPTKAEITHAVNQLKKGVQIWVSGKAEANYIHDESWGGLVNCGCRYEGKGEKGFCNNTFPDCPALVDVNEDFGNGTFVNKWHSTFSSSIS